MAAQSFAMGQAFGTSFQYGKRKISSLSNDEFNALSATRLHDDLQADVRAMIPSMNQSFDRMEKFQIEIIQSMLDTFVLALQEFGKFLVGGIQAGGDAANQAFNTDVLTVQTRADIPSIIPQAEGATGGGTQKFVADYIIEAKKLPFKLLADIVEKMLSGKLGKPIERRIAYIQVYKEIIAKIPKKLTPKQQLEVTAKKIGQTATGLIAQIAGLFAQVKFELNGTFTRLNNPARKATARRNFFKIAKLYNQTVQAAGKRNLTIDTAKSLAQKRIVPRFT